MSGPVAPLHTWTLARKSQLIRYYAWCFGKESLATVNFCKLFWAVALAPAIVGMLLAGKAVAGIIDAFPERKPAKPLTADELDAEIKRRDARKAKGHARIARLVNFVSGIADRVVAFFGRHPGIGKSVGAVGTGALVALPFAAIGALTWTLVSFPHGSFDVLWRVGAILGGAALWIAAVIGLAVLAERGRFRFIVDALSAAVHGVADALCFVGRFFRTGHHAIKHRTCPKVEVSG